ncbi:MAG: hypothetical protein D6732_01355 [Methanobacteriota archaeon]|nr:MAG: hypothetical protein D6732_01355 [Euryarchaeota archaeon]
MNPLYTFAMVHLLGVISVALVLPIWLIPSGFWYHVFWKRMSSRFSSFTEYLIYGGTEFGNMIYMLFMAVCLIFVTIFEVYIFYIFDGYFFNVKLVFATSVFLNLWFQSFRWLARSNYKELQKENPDFMRNASVLKVLNFIIDAPKVALKHWNVKGIKVGFYEFLVMTVIIILFDFFIWYDFLSV